MPFWTQSTFKGSTQLNLLYIGAPADIARRLPRYQQLRIKLEMDMEPPLHATTEARPQLLPSPYQVKLYDLPSLFAGKLHAVLCRGWKNRVKERDFYDFVWLTMLYRWMLVKARA